MLLFGILFLFGDMMEDIDLKEALDIARKRNTKIVWLGIEPVPYVADLIKVDKNQIIQMSATEISIKNETELKKFEEHIFLCYHGNTSRAVVNYIKKKGVNSYNLKGGITSIAESTS